VTTALIISVIGLHLIMLWLIRNDLRARTNGARGRWSDATPIEWPLVQVFAPPQTVPGAANNHLLALRMCFLLLGLVAAWVVATTLPFTIDVRSHGVLAGAVALGALAVTVIPAWVWSGESSRLADALCTIHDCAQARSQLTRVTRVLFVTVLATLVLFIGLTVNIVWQSATRDEGTLVLARYVGGGVVSPAAVTLLTMAALYVALITSLRRLSLVGYGYSCLADHSAMFSLLAGPTAGERQERASSRLASILDMPAQHLPGPYVLAVCAVAILASWYVFDTSTIDGLWFTYFLAVSAVAILAIGLLLVAQGLATWNIARSHLKRLVRSPIHARLETVAGYVPWDISLSPPRLTELIPVARMADGVAREFRRAACAMPLSTVGSQVRRSRDGLWTLSVAAVNDVPVRQDDLQGLCSLLTPSSHVEQLTTEMAQRQHAALIQSDSWYGMWKFSDVIVSVMQRSVWRRSDMPAHPVRRSVTAETAGRSSSTHANASSVPPTEASAHGEKVESEHTFLDRCEQLIALQVAFVLRDIVARTVTCLFSAMLCLTLLTAAHLLYSFNGRNTMLTLDMLAVAATALISVWILIDMERDAVLSRLRTTTAGRVNINWDFLRRIAVYGVVPLLVVLSSLFPEIGGTLFGWLEPLRKLSTL